MIADLKPYPEYQESGLPWVGHVPKHWDLVPNRGLVRIRKKLVGKRHNDYQLLSLTKQGVIVRDISTGKGKFSSDMGTSQEVRRGDFVFCLFDVPETPRTVGLSHHDGMITGAYTVFESRGVGRDEYFELFYQAMDDQKLLSPLYSGLRNTIPRDKLLGTKTPQPSLPEQAAIVRFLQWSNGRLERAIRAKRKVIALLNEQRQAIIHRAVTLGLDPSVPLKPSGIPWLGDIPQHWEVRRLRTLVHRIEQGVSPLAVGFLAEGDSWGVLKSGCVNRGVFRETEHKQLARNFKIDPAIIVKIGDVLISRACGSPTLVGSVGRVRSLRYRLILSDKTFRACFRGHVDVDFMVFAMNCRYYRHQVEQAISGAEGMANNLPLSSLRDFSFAIPPTKEASVIAGYLEGETAGLHMTICRLEREIELLREYRARLVADVVTGKLDVREAAARLPDEAAPDIAEDESDMSDEIESAEEEVAAA